MSSLNILTVRGILKAGTEHDGQHGPVGAHRARRGLSSAKPWCSFRRLVPGIGAFGSESNVSEVNVVVVVTPRAETWPSRSAHAGGRVRPDRYQARAHYDAPVSSPVSSEPSLVVGCGRQIEVARVSRAPS